jgi:hypothetical protein
LWDECVQFVVSCLADGKERVDDRCEPGGGCSVGGLGQMPWRFGFDEPVARLCTA